MALALAASRLKTYTSFVKLEHTVFSLPLIYAGALLGADGWPSPRLLLLILLAAIGGRVASMGLNRLIDLEIDRRNPRTRMRELPRGAMQVWEGWLIVSIGTALYLVSAAAISPICLALAPIPLLLFVGYPYLKRFTNLSHLGLGLAWSMAPLGGWLATAQSLAGFREIVWLWAFAILWVTGFDIIYATMDEAFDRQARLYALPATLGRDRALRVAALLHGLAYLALYGLYRGQLTGAVAFGWLVVTGALLIWEHLVAPRKPEFAFFQINAIVGLCVFGLVFSGI